METNEEAKEIQLAKEEMHKIIVEEQLRRDLKDKEKKMQAEQKRIKEEQMKSGTESPSEANKMLAATLGWRIMSKIIYMDMAKQRDQIQDTVTFVRDIIPQMVEFENSAEHKLLEDIVLSKPGALLQQHFKKTIKKVKKQKVKKDLTSKPIIPKP